MPSDPEILKQVPLFAGLDQDEINVLAGQVELKKFGPHQRIYRIGDSAGRGYIVVSGSVRVATIDEDGQEVVVDQPARGEFFGFASMLEQIPHQTEAIAMDDAVCVEVDRQDIFVLLQRKPHAGMDMLAVLGHQFHTSQKLVRIRANRDPNQVIEEQETMGERVADGVAAFGGSWKFIGTFAVTMLLYLAISVELGRRSWDPYPFILLNLFLSLLAAIQAPVIMMSQNRQDKKDRVRSELDYEVNRRSHKEIQGLAQKLNLLGDRLGDVEDLLRTRSSAT